MDDEAADQVADPADGREVLHRIVGRLAQRRLHAERGVGREQERVAVGCGLGGRLGADDAARPAAVLDDELLAEGLAQLVGPGPADEVRGAARRVGEDELDRPLRPADRLRGGPRGDAGDQRRSRQAQELATTHARSPDALLVVAAPVSPSSRARASPAPPSRRRHLRHEVGIVLGVHVAPDEIVFVVEFRHLRVVVGLLEGIVQLLDDRRVHALGAGETERRVELVGVSELLEDRRVGPLLAALAPEHHQQAQLPGVDQRAPDRRFHHRHDVAAEHLGNRLAAPLGRDVGELNARLARHQLHGDRVGGGGTDRRVRELAGIGLGEVDDVLPLLEGTVGLDDRAEAVASHQDDVGEVLDRIEGGLLHVGDAEDGDGDLPDGVAVGLGGAGHRCRTQRGAAAGLVVDDHRLTQMRRGGFRDAPEQEIGAHAGLERHDQGNGLRRKIVGRGQGRRQKRPASAAATAAAIRQATMHRISSLVFSACCRVA